MSKYYIAYGSNLNFDQMSKRCPSAVFVGKGMVKDYQLLFCRVATIVPLQGAEVPVGVWLIEESDEENLDLYEGYPKLYRKETIAVSGIDGIDKAMVYIMNEGHADFPNVYYYYVIREGYNDTGLDLEYLERALDYTSEVIVQSTENA